MAISDTIADAIKATAKSSGLKSVVSLNPTSTPLSSLASGASGASGAAASGSAAASAGGLSSFQNIFSSGSQAFGMYEQINAQATQSKMLASQTAAQQQTTAAQLASQTKSIQLQLTDKVSNLAIAKNDAVSAYQQALATNGQTVQNLQSSLSKTNDSINILQQKIYQDTANNCYAPGTAEYNAANANIQADKLSLNNLQVNANEIQRQIITTNANTANLAGKAQTAQQAYDQSVQVAQANGAYVPNSPDAAGNDVNGSQTYSNTPQLQLASYKPGQIPSAAIDQAITSRGGQILTTDTGDRVVRFPDGSEASYSDVSGYLQENPQDVAAATGASTIPASASVTNSAKTASGSAASLEANNPYSAANLGKFAGATATAAGSGFGLFSSVEGMAQNGASFGGVLGAGASLGGLALGMTMLGHTAVFGSFIGTAATATTAGTWGSIASIPLIGHALSSGLTFLFTNPWGIAIVAAAIAVTAILMALLGKKPDAQEQQLADMANQLSVWDTTTKPLILSAAAFGALVSMGYSIDKPLGDINAAGLSVPVVALNQKLTGSLTNADGSAFAGAGIPYNTPIIVKGAAAGGGDEVLELTQGGMANGKAVDHVKTYALSKNMAFTKPTNSANLYIPFFVNGKVNPEAVNAVQTQNTLLNSASGLSATSQVTAVQVAGAANKQDVTATPIPSN